MTVSLKALVTHCQSGVHNGGLWVVAKHSNIINKNSGWKKNKQQPSFHSAGAVPPEVDRSRLLSGIEVALIRRNASWWTVTGWHFNYRYTMPLKTDIVQLACPTEEGFYNSGAIRCLAVCQTYYLQLLSDFIFHFQISYLYLARLCTRTAHIKINWAALVRAHIHTPTTTASARCDHKCLPRLPGFVFYSCICCWICRFMESSQSRTASTRCQSAVPFYFNTVCHTHARLCVCVGHVQHTLRGVHKHTSKQNTLISAGNQRDP